LGVTGPGSQLNVTVVDGRGLPLMCETEGCGDKATSAWSGAWSGAFGPRRLSCDRHNPWSATAMPLPLNFTSHSLCHACGQPVPLSSQVVYPGTAGIDPGGQCHDPRLT
jgi:hypothetical protein